MERRLRGGIRSVKVVHSRLPVYRNCEALEQYQDRYTLGTQSSFMLKFSGEVAAT
jgi:hypothetical protein